MTHIKLKTYSSRGDDCSYIYVPYGRITFARHLNEGSIVSIYSIDDVRHVAESPEEIMALIEEANAPQRRGKEQRC